jgi:hypothetical protein
MRMSNHRVFLPSRLLGSLLVALLAGVAHAGTLFTANLNGAQEVPPTSSTATGHADCYLNRTETSLRIQLSASNFTNTITAAHVHQGLPGVSGPVIFDIGAFTGSTAVDWPLTAADVANLKAGNLYVNVHSNVFPGGEIRGQLGAASSYSLAASLDGSQEVPPTGSPGTGAADLTANGAGTALHIDLTVSGLSSTITASHIHQGAAGSNGPVMIGLGSFTTRLVQDVALTPDQLSGMLLGQTYVNVHTTTFPGGEIRGQIEPADPSTVDRGEGAVSSVGLSAGENPTSGPVDLRYRLPRSGRAELAIYDLQGRILRRLLDGNRAAGEGAVLWDGRNSRGLQVPSGVYFARLTGLGLARTLRLVVAR